MLDIDIFIEKIKKKSRLMGIDPGGKRIGIAISDENKIVATPYTTIIKEKYGDFVSQIKEIISHAPSDVNGILVGIDKSGCSGSAYKLDYAKNIDPMKYEVIEKDGIKIFIEPKATMFLIGSEMDYSTDKLSSRFVFNNPNEKSTCGCGESFSI